jgi:hypothetical protein
MEDSVESWEEKIVYGQEFQNHSWVILDRLRKSTEYYLKIVAFSLVSEGWPSAEILNSTLDDSKICSFSSDIYTRLLHIQ